MKQINSFLKAALMVSLVLALMAVYERPIDQEEFTIHEPAPIKFLIALVTWSLVFVANYIADLRLVFIKTRVIYYGAAFVSVFLCATVMVYIQNVIFKAPPGMSLTDPILINQTTYSACWLSLITRCFKVLYDYVDRTRKAAIKNEKLVQENAKSHFALLNQQVNPHFLFNSLNTLVDLIDKENRSAISFVKEFSSVYRYVLSCGTKDLVTLKDELAFLESYLFVLRQRFDDKLQIHLDIDKSKLKQQIPPLTIQTLVENALKHNELSSTHPLAIHIRFKDNKLEVQNTVHLREKVVSNGVGLKNLTSRVKFLTGRQVSYGRENGHFIVSVPVAD